jgi:hypothetical protein
MPKLIIMDIYQRLSGPRDMPAALRHLASAMGTILLQSASQRPETDLEKNPHPGSWHV